MLDEATDREAMSKIPDSTNRSHLTLDRVGFKGIRHPITVKNRSGGEQQTIAIFNMYVSLPTAFNGSSVSDFVEMLNRYDSDISARSFHDMLSRMMERLHAKASYLEMSFPYFINKSAPISGVQSLLDYGVTFIGEANADRLRMDVGVMVPVTSLCPCSKKISRYGAHNQRSLVTVTARIRQFLWVEELIEMVEREASCEIYGLLKRPDEKYVTEKAYDNPKFVEDIVRDVAIRLNADGRISGYVVEAENFESIHNHSAYAMIRKNHEETRAMQCGRRTESESANKTAGG